MDVVVTLLPSVNLINHVCLDPSNIFHPSPSSSLSFPSPECSDLSAIDSHIVLEGNKVGCFESLGTFRGYDPLLNVYSLYLYRICLEKLC